MRTLLPVFSLLFATVAFGYSTSLPWGYAYDPPAQNTCHVCHWSYPLNSGDGSLDVSGLADYQPGQTYTFTLQLNDDVVRAGFQATVKDAGFDFAGELISLDSTTTLNGPYINHSAAGTYTSDSGGIWAFGWVAPEEGSGPLTLSVSALASDNNGGQAGDYVYAEQWTIAEGMPDPHGMTVTPVVTTVPAQGGAVEYSLHVWTSSPVPLPGVSYWTTVTLPGGTATGPLLHVTTALPAMADILVDLEQNVPAFAPTGTYVHTSRIGYFPNALRTVEFEFEKLGVATGAATVESWAARKARSAEESTR